MNKLANYICGQWEEGDGTGSPLYNAYTNEIIAYSTTKGLDMQAALSYGRSMGAQLRKMTFVERGLMLKKLALYLHARKDKYYPISFQTGATKADSWVDIEGGIGNLFANASLRRQFSDLPYIVEGEDINLSKTGDFHGRHILVPKRGIAIHINAFNFPIWGMLEKIAVNLLAGVPTLVKPATLTSYLTEAMVRDIIDSEILPQGSLQLLCGSAGDLLDYVQMEDVVTFTGSASTGRMLKTHPQIIAESVPFNMEADSLNCIVLGPDVQADDPEFELFIKEIRREMTSKSGQKCTAIRRIIAPENMIDPINKSLRDQLSKVRIGDPSQKETQMGTLAGTKQLEEVKENTNRLIQHAQLIYGSMDEVNTYDHANPAGAFMSPILILQEKPFEHKEAHEIEAFGPVATIMPYQRLEDAIELSRMGKGSLVSSFVSMNPKDLKSYVMETAAYHGRIHILNRLDAKASTGHGSPLPMLVHGGPGRAGGGEEMGGILGVKHYMQRCAVQASATNLTQVTDIYHTGSAYLEPPKHPFQMHFDDLQIGQTIITAKRTITESDIVNFANVSWDHFYAHTDITALNDTPFEQRVAHGYFILSAAAGLFVDAAKGPVILNYGLDSCRFTKPVYPGMTIGVRLTVKEKIRQEKREDENYAKGIVKFLVDVYDETDETVAIATILTMVKRASEFTEQL